MGDLELLQEFADRHSDEAFRTLVERHIDFVYSVALRQLHDVHAAQEVTQAVFIDLAAKARVISEKTVLSGWLFRAVRFAAAKLVRSELRRQRREREAAQMEPSIQETKTESPWEQMEPILNEALEELSERDRCAVLLRFFEKKPLKDVGVAMGLKEAAAKKRVSRAVEKLRIIFGRRGIAIPSAVLLTTLSAHTLAAAPTGLVSTIAATAVMKGTALSASTLTLGKGILNLMAWSKLKIASIAAASLLLVGGTTTYVINHSATSATDEDEAILRIIDSMHSRELDKAPPIVFLRASKASANEQGSIVSNGKMMSKGAPAKSLLYSAYGVTQSRIVSSTALPAERYDMLVSLPSGQKEALQKVIREKLGLTAHKETREQDFYVLQAKTGDFPGLQVSARESGGSSVHNTDGQLTLVNSSIGALARNLEGFLNRPVINETGLKDRFDVTLTWGEEDDNERPGHERLKQLLAEQLGLELTADRREVELLVVQTANAP